MRSVKNPQNLINFSDLNSYSMIHLCRTSIKKYLSIKKNKKINAPNTKWAEIYTFIIASTLKIMDS